MEEPTGTLQVYVQRSRTYGLAVRPYYISLTRMLSYFHAVLAFLDCGFQCENCNLVRREKARQFLFGFLAVHLVKH